MNDISNKTNISQSKQEKGQQTLIRIEELSNTIDDLNELCNNLDPYQPIDEEMKQKLSQYRIFDNEDPFLTTNKLVLILENSVEELISLGGTP